MYKKLRFSKLVGRPHSDGKVANRLRYSKFRYVKDLKDPQVVVMFLQLTCKLVNKAQIDRQTWTARS